MPNDWDNDQNEQDNPMARLRSEYEEAIKELKALKKDHSTAASELAQLKAEQQRAAANQVFQSAGLNPAYAEWYLSAGGTELTPEAVSAWAAERGLAAQSETIEEEPVDEGYA